MRYFITLSYNGAAFSGWQIQNNAISVQETLQNALSTLLKESIAITGAGRTDAGVNAINYIAHFNSQTIISKNQMFIYKINAILPKEICVSNILEVHPTAHARFDAVARTYKYFIHIQKDPFNNSFSYFVPPKELNFEKMNEAAKFFLGEMDFSSLEKVNGGNNTSICNVTHALWEPVKSFPDLQNCKNINFENSTHFVFTVTANRFLRNMVRAMVGSLLEVGMGKKEPEWIAQMLLEKNRCAAGHSVPGNALFLYKIEYPYI